jgi:serine protease Do
MEEEVLEKIERYLKKLMNSEEQDAFEKEMKEHPSLHQKVNEYQKVFSAFDALQQRAALKSKLDAFHQDLPKGGKVISFADYFRKKKFAIAASMALLLSVGTAGYLLMQNNNSLENTRREVEVNSPKAPLPGVKTHPVSSPADYAATAFMISTKGYLVTAKHIVDDADEIMVENGEGELFSAIVVYMDPRRDLAFLRIKDTNFVKPAALPYAFVQSNADLGDKVFTLGFPQNKIVYDEGVMSGRLGYEGDTSSCQVSLSVNGGNSGGPLFDDKGNVIGMIFGKERNKDRVGFALTMKSITDAVKYAPAGTFKTKPKFNSSNKISGLKRSKQIKKVEGFVYQVKVN